MMRERSAATVAHAAVSSWLVRRHLIHAGLAVAACVTGCDWLLGLRSFSPGSAIAIDAPVATPLVQQVTFSLPSATALTGAFQMDPTPGNVVVMVGAAVNFRLATVSGGGVTTWKRAAMSDHQTNVEIWYGVVDTVATPVTIDCVPGCTSLEEIWMLLTEWSGLDTSNLADGSGGGSTGSVTPASTSAATLHAPDLLIFAVSTPGNVGDATDPAGGTWVGLHVVEPSSIEQAAWYQVAPSSGTFAPHADVAARWDAALAAFRMTPP